MESGNSIFKDTPSKQELLAKEAIFNKKFGVDCLDQPEMFLPQYQQ